MNEAALARVRRLVQAAAEIADATTPMGRRARAELPAVTRLSAAGVELALCECLETHPSERELQQLLESVNPAPRAHVALPSNVFVAALRALALALAQSAHVYVRPSRREPLFAALLATAAPGLFELVLELEPEPGDSLWAYGSDSTLAAFGSRLAPGVRLHAQGPGFGVAVVHASAATAECARALASDIVPFEQRGCLSPRLLLFVGSNDEASAFAALLAAELRVFAKNVPPGLLEPDEAAAVTRFRDAHAYAGELLEAGPGWVASLEGERLVPAPVGRNLVLVPTLHPEALLASIASDITALGVAGDPPLTAALAPVLPNARFSALGRMQRPLFDGPADRRGRA